MRAVGILLCAGTSQRMGFDKLTEPLCGKSAIERSMDALVQGGAEALVCAVSPMTRAFVEALPCPVPRRLAPGGETRGASVLAALTAADAWLGDGPCIALIHDAARCLVPPALVRACLESAERFGSGVAAVPVTDTVLRAEEGGAAEVPRAGLWRMQTPQAFRVELIRQAHDAARRDGFLGTDDASLLEHAGLPVYLCEGSRENLKLTTPTDLMLAELILAARAEKELMG